MSPHSAGHPVFVPLPCVVLNTIMGQQKATNINLYFFFTLMMDLFIMLCWQNSTITIPAMGRRFTVTNCFPGRTADAFSCALPNILELSVCSHLSFYLRCLQPPIDNDVDNEVSFGVSQLAECLQDVFSAVTLKDCWVGMNLWLVSTLNRSPGRPIKLLLSSSRHKHSSAAGDNRDTIRDKHWWCNGCWVCWNHVEWD